MDKINFQDLPSTETPINSTNLNQIQDNVDSAKVETTTTVTTTNTDLNDYIQEGRYVFTGSVTPTNIPTGVAGILEVYASKDGRFVKQVWHRLGTTNTNDYQTFIRTFDNQWSNWREYGMKPGNLEWTNVTLTSQFKPYNNVTSNTPRYCKSGQTVELQGIVSPSSEITGSDTQYTIFTLPSGYRPSKQIYRLCQGSSKRNWLMTITTNGDVTFSRYGVSSYENASTSAWLPFGTTFLVN